KIDVSFVLFKEPTVEGKFQKFSFTPAGRERVFVTVSSFPRYFYGQELHIRGTVKQQKIFAKNTKNESTETTSLLRTENVINTMFFPTIEAREVWLFSSLSALRKNLITIFSSTLSPATESLMLGIVFGIRSTMPNDLAERLRTTGVIHITAASGMNVTMVAGAVFFLLAGFLRRQIAIVVGFLFVWMYALLAGFEPSILRASIMSSFAFGASLIGRQNTGILALLLTASLMLLISPSLLQDVGFLLSCFATLGIILFGQIAPQGQFGIDPLQKREGSLLGSFRQDIQTTVAAQAGTLPILFAYFGQYNLLSIVVNALILWTIPILMTLGAAGAVVGLIYRPFASLILYLSLPLLSYIAFVVDVFSRYPAFVQLQNVPIVFVIGYYCIFFSVYLFFRSKRL
ncbi:MAG: ComEC/Rec2 family competence protein, partial [bacterium]|nr:ComEC/Rec2 family competence protein [bacterium]